MQDDVFSTTPVAVCVRMHMLGYNFAAKSKMHLFIYFYLNFFVIYTTVSKAWG